jgi:hypothetical protein
LVWRHSLLSHAYAAIPQLDPATIISALLGWAHGYVAWQQTLGLSPFLVLSTAALFLLALLWAVVRQARAASALILLLGATILPQLTLAGPFAVMLTGEPLGTMTYARFFYAPWLVLTALMALGVTAMSGWRPMLMSALLILATLASAWPVRPLSQQYAAWSSGPVHRMARAAADLLEQPARAGTEPSCLLVLLDTQKQDPPRWFARFADAAAKAHAKRIEQAAHCYVMTEMTPYLFVLPQEHADERPQALHPIINPDGSTKKMKAGLACAIAIVFPRRIYGASKGRGFSAGTGKAFGRRPPKYVRRPKRFLLYPGDFERGFT